MALTTNGELFNEILSPMNFNPDVKLKDFTRKRTQAVSSNSTKHILSDKISQFDCTDSKMESKIAFECHQRGTNRKTMHISNEQEKTPETLRLKESDTRQQNPVTFGLNSTLT